MNTLLIMIAAGVGACLVGAIRTYYAARRPRFALQSRTPARLRRSDFKNPDADWLVVLFSSSTCASCEAVWDEVAAYESSRIAVDNIESLLQRQLHRRYHIESVPTVVIANPAGTVRFAHIGPLGTAERNEINQVLTHAESR